ncbi:LysE family translocator [Croceiramulus getboli]|nr:LysE family translocator [Flavobacteriaceae bacterium YJPT1-3]
MWEALFSFSLATAALALSPGPDNIFVLTQSMAYGSKSGLAIVCGLISGCIVHTTLIAFGVSALISTSPWMMTLIKVFGSAYLLYLAYQVFRSDGSIQLEGGGAQKSPWNYFKQGVAMNLLNPKVILFFLAFFPAFLWKPEEDTVMQFYVLGLTFMGVSFILFALIALLAGHIKHYIEQNQRAGQVMRWAQLIVFVGIAVFIWI